MAKVIVKYLDGKEKTGNVLAFNINQPAFHLQVEDKDGQTVTSTERMNSVKVVLFLKKEEPGGSNLRTETIDQSVFAGALAMRLIVEFTDGTIVHGSTNKYNPNDKGFFIVPINPADKSVRIFINAHAVKHVETLKLFGKVLIDHKKITEEQLDAALQRQKEMREKRIGMILKEQNIITDHQLNESIEKQKKSPKMLGQILLEAGYITAGQLDIALNVQHEQKKKKLGQILVELKFLTPSDICIALATQFSCSWIDLSEVEIPADIATILPEEVVKKWEVIPVEKKGNDILVVATSQPQDPNIRVEVRRACPMNVEFVVAYEVYIAKKIEQFFPGREGR